MTTGNTSGAMHPLKKWRGKSTLDEAAKKLGTSAAALSRYENLITFPRGETARRIARIAGLKLEQLYPDVPRRQPKKRKLGA